LGAAIRRIAYLTLTSEWDKSAEFCRLIYSDENGFNRARGLIENGQGVGRDVISRYLERRLSKTAIESALATIKSSDLHPSRPEKTI